MKKTFLRGYLVISMVLLLLLGYASLSNRQVKAAGKASYKVEFVSEGQMQQILEQRSSEGWELVSVSVFATNPTQPTAAMVFKR
jgi:hypothetical protein